MCDRLLRMISGSHSKTMDPEYVLVYREDVGARLEIDGWQHKGYARICS